MARSKLYRQHVRVFILWASGSECGCGNGGTTLVSLRTSWPSREALRRRSYIPIVITAIPGLPYCLGAHLGPVTGVGTLSTLGTLRISTHSAGWDGRRPCLK
ncbi:hypothetical protein E2C01_095214 [Portunus trituberculatus]|uniref:Uncharacterized protein n=1 Tax=Portunus trituberculatus TaxID=210409 RepID=A0A5B7K3M1_PORTR|nr:hypothetical protein [Portunus trituberculatus]